MKDLPDHNTQYKPVEGQSLTQMETIATLGVALSKAGYPNVRIAQLNQTANSPDDVILLLQTLKDLADAGTGWEDMSELIDNSCYSIVDWAKAIVSFLTWKGHLRQKFDSLSMLSYLSCSAEAAANSPILQCFEEQVEEMLETFGYEG